MITGYKIIEADHPKELEFAVRELLLKREGWKLGEFCVSMCTISGDSCYTTYCQTLYQEQVYSDQSLGPR